MARPCGRRTRLWTASSVGVSWRPGRRHLVVKIDVEAWTYVHVRACETVRRFGNAFDFFWESYASSDPPLLLEHLGCPLTFSPFFWCFKGSPRNKVRTPNESTRCVWKQSFLSGRSLLKESKTKHRRPTLARLAPFTTGQGAQKRIGVRQKRRHIHQRNGWTRTSTCRWLPSTGTSSSRGRGWTSSGPLMGRWTN